MSAQYFTLCDGEAYVEDRKITSRQKIGKK